MAKKPTLTKRGKRRKEQRLYNKRKVAERAADLLARNKIEIAVSSRAGLERAHALYLQGKLADADGLLAYAHERNHVNTMIDYIVRNNHRLLFEVENNPDDIVFFRLNVGE